MVVAARKGETPETAGWLGREKMAPMVSLWVYDTLDEAVDWSCRLLAQSGLGHCASIHTQDVDLARRFAAAVPASRVLVNQPAATACAGSGNPLAVSLTLGCGYWGGSSTNDNVTARHLRNVTHLAFPVDA